MYYSVLYKGESIDLRITVGKGCSVRSFSLSICFLAIKVFSLNQFFEAFMKSKIYIFK